MMTKLFSGNGMSDPAKYPKPKLPNMPTGMVGATKGKGSQEAKDKMAALRAMRGNSKGKGKKKAPKGSLDFTIKVQ
jgi:hypothetical protein